MAISWNNVAAPNLGESNSLFAQAIASLRDAGAGLQTTAKDYQTVVRNKNLGLIQEYVNSAKTPEELQSEGFQIGLANLIKPMRNEYDALAKAQLVDKAADTLLSRKANQVSIARNEFGLSQDQLTAKKAQNAAKLYALRNDPLAYKVEEQRQVAEGALDINAAQNIPLNALNLDSAIVDNRVKKESAESIIASALLDPKVKQANIDTAYGNLAVARKNAETERLKALAAAERAEAERRAKQNEKNPALLLLTGIDKINAAYNSDLLKPSGDPKVADSLETWWDGKNTWWRSNTDLDNIKTILSTDPKTAKLPGKMQVAIADIAYTTIMNENALGRNMANTGSATEQAEKAVKAAIDKVETQKNDYLYSQKIPLYRDAVRQQMIQTGERNPVKAASQVGMDEYEMYRTNIRTDLQNMAESVYESSGSTLPKEQFVDKFIYNTVNKKPVDDLVKPKQEVASVPAQSSSTFLNALGTGSYEDKLTLLNSELKKTNDPIQIAFLNNELKKLEKDAPPVTANTSNSLQEQQQRMEAAALARLTAAALKQNGQPPVTPTITAKPEEFKPRELTPAEKQQAERMNQEALVRLTGAKLTEEQAKAQKQFPTTPLKELAKAVTPVPSPLVPVESQNAFKSRDNNLSINLSTGKSVPSKDPVPMPNVSWGKPAEVVTMNPIVAKLPQYKAVATFVGDGDTFSAKSDSYATKGEKAKKAGGILCRVDSVDAPETEHKGYGSFKGKLGQPYGEEAGKKLQQMILNKEISIRIVRASNGDPNEPGLYGRDICQIEVEGANVSTELIRAGAAWLYREYNNYFTGLETVEANAKAEGRGLFSDPNAVYPPTAKHNGSLNLR